MQMQTQSSDHTKSQVTLRELSFETHAVAGPDRP
jgi:hypothetical protein